MHQCRLKLVLTNHQRRHAYREWFSIDLDKTTPDIRKAINFSMKLGNRIFQRQNEYTLSLNLGHQSLDFSRKSNENNLH